MGRVCPRSGCAGCPLAVLNALGFVRWMRMVGQVVTPVVAMVTEGVTRTSA